MDFYRINEEYNKFLQRYEKEKRGVTKVPNIVVAKGLDKGVLWVEEYFE